MNHEIELKNIEPGADLTRVKAVYFTHIGSYGAIKGITKI